MSAVSVGDADLYYEEAGGGEPLLLVPGLSGRGSFWVSQITDFARDFRVVVHDHRGTGRSTHSRIRYSVEQMAGDVLRLMDALGIHHRSAHGAPSSQPVNPRTGLPSASPPSVDPGASPTTPAPPQAPPPIPQTGPPRPAPPAGQPITPSTVDPRTGLPR